jgi:Putative Flp pilus-assembly TadE/G-like
MRRNKQAGQALVLTAVALVVLMGFAGLAIDMGVLRYEKRLQQTAADAAAIAGANNLAYGGVTVGAQNAAASNGFTDNSGNGGSCTASGPPAPPSNAAPGWIQVTICNPPSSADPYHASQTGYVEAWVTEIHPTYFMRVLGINSEAVTARAVATDTSGSGSGGSGCIDTLGSPNKRIEPGISTSGSVSLYAPTCGINDNGNLITGGGANLSITAASIGVSGSVTQNGTGTVSPTPQSGVPALGDPISATAPCSGSSCPSSGPIKITAGSCSGTGCAGNVTCSGGTCAISPGNYDDICVGSGAAVNFMPGLYVMNGNSVCNAGTEFQINANATVCNSTNPDCSGMMGSANSGVTFYMTGSGSVNIDGTATVQLSAPNSGTYEGMLFYQDPSDTASATISGNDTSSYQGALYFPTAQLTFGGNNSTTGTFNGGAAYTLLVSSWLTLAGNPTIVLNSDYSGLSGNGGPLAGAITSARLVE